MMAATASPSRALSTYTRARDSSALLSSKEGFSVVAPMKVMVPSSMWGRKASCWALLNRCTSSTNSTVGLPARQRHSRASSMAARISFTPESTADRLMKRASQ